MFTLRLLSGVTLALGAALPMHAQGAFRAALSSRASTEVTLTLIDSAARAAAKPSAIRIEYGQPHLRGRKLNTDSLVPYDKAWRLGANDATRLTTDVDLMLGGVAIPKGAYVLQAMPSRAGWKLLVQKEAAGTSPMAAAMTNDPAKDMARIDLNQTTLALPMESMTIWLIPSRDAGPPSGELRIQWGTVSLSTMWSAK